MAHRNLSFQLARLSVYLQMKRSGLSLINHLLLLMADLNIPHIVFKLGTYTNLCIKRQLVLFLPLEIIIAFTRPYESNFLKYAHKVDYCRLEFSHVSHRWDIFLIVLQSRLGDCFKCTELCILSGTIEGRNIMLRFQKTWYLFPMTGLVFHFLTMFIFYSYSDLKIHRLRDSRHKSKIQHLHRMNGLTF